MIQDEEVPSPQHAGSPVRHATGVVGDLGGGPERIALSLPSFGSS